MLLLFRLDEGLVELSYIINLVLLSIIYTVGRIVLFNLIIRPLLPLRENDNISNADDNEDKFLSGIVYFYDG